MATSTYNQLSLPTRTDMCRWIKEFYLPRRFWREFIFPSARWIRMHGKLLIWGEAGSGKLEWARIIYVVASHPCVMLTVHPELSEPFVEIYGLHSLIPPPLFAELPSNFDKYTGVQALFQDQFRFSGTNSMQQSLFVFANNFQEVSISMQRRINSILESINEIPKLFLLMSTDISPDLLVPDKLDENLFYKCYGFTVKIPSIIEYREDEKLALINRILDVESEKRFLGKPKLTSEVIKFLKSLPLPGNYYQLRSIIAGALQRCDRNALQLRDFDVGKILMTPEKLLQKQNKMVERRRNILHKLRKIFGTRQTHRGTPKSHNINTLQQHETGKVAAVQSFGDD